MVRIDLTHPRPRSYNHAYAVNPGSPVFLKGKVAILSSAYFDESGHDERLLVVGGLVSEPARWVEFTAECQQIREHFKIPYIHAQKLLNLKSSKPYGHLSQKDRNDVLGCLIGAIYRHAEFSVFSAVIPVEYCALTTPEYRARHGTEYALCVQGLLLRLWEKFSEADNAVDETVSVFFEEGPHAGEALEVVRNYKASIQEIDLPVIGERPPHVGLQIGAIGTGDKKTTPPLWAADLVSHCIYSQIMFKDGQCREIMDVLEDRVPSYELDWNEDKITHFVNSSLNAKAENDRWRAETHEFVKYLRREFGIKTKKHPRGIILDSSEMNQDQKRRFFEEAPSDPADEMDSYSGQNELP